MDCPLERIPFDSIVHVTLRTGWQCVGKLIGIMCDEATCRQGGVYIVVQPESGNLQALWSMELKNIERL